MSNDSSRTTAETRVRDNPQRIRPALLTGLYIGALLTIAMLTALVGANRVPRLEPYALERNAASYGAFAILMLVPILVFLKRPLQMFVSAIVAWVLFAAAYRLAGFYFHNLFDGLRTPFVALIEGSVLYGVTAVLCWVAGMGFRMRHRAIAPRRRRVGPEDVVRYDR
jgi:hypothetical protein